VRGMRTTLLVAVAALAACQNPDAGCEPYPDNLEQIGDVPLYAAETIEMAQFAAPCDGVDWRIRIEWVEDYFACGEAGTASGCYARWRDDSCAPRVTVKRFPSSLSGALAHELGHHVSAECGLGWGEYEADRFGTQVEILVRSKYGP
jgi:hypothetical protein